MASSVFWCLGSWDRIHVGCLGKRSRIGIGSSFCFTLDVVCLERKSYIFDCVTWNSFDKRSSGPKYPLDFRPFYGSSNGWGHTERVWRGFICWTFIEIQINLYSQTSIGYCTLLDTFAFKRCFHQTSFPEFSSEVQREDCSWDHKRVVAHVFWRFCVVNLPSPWNSKKVVGTCGNASNPWQGVVEMCINDMNLAALMQRQWNAVSMRLHAHKGH